MKRKIILFPIMVLLLSFSLMAQWHVQVESGIAFEGYNDVRIPNDEGTLFSFRDDFELQGLVLPFRLRVGYTFAERHHVTALFAPLSIRYEGDAPRDIIFQNTLFEEGLPIEGLYKFNSYRLTYRYEFLRGEAWTLGAGITGKVRDARVRLTTTDMTARKNDLGFVPLLHLFARYQPGAFALQLKGDGWYVTQGRAFDIDATARFRVSDNIWLYSGYRIIEGGADVEEVYNFTLISSVVVGVSWGM
jgi:hypothetical protein